MKLHQAIKDIVSQKGKEMIANTQIINFLLDYQAFKEKPATKLILRDIVNSGYAEEILTLDTNNAGWDIAFMKFERDFIDSCGYKDDLVKYVFEAIAYGIGLQLGSNEPSITPDIDVDSFFDIPEEAPENPSPNSGNANQNQNVNPSDLYTIALTFYNEGKFAQAKSFIEKSVSLFHNSAVPSIQLKLKGDINMKLGCFAEAISDFNNCFARKAVEVNLKIDELREQLKEHKIKGFENSMFCYYLCLYSLGKLNNDQWLKLVKAEAMSGINDAILFCANNRIDPMDNHIDIYFVDKDKLQTGDYLYSDGTFAHELSKSKTVIARVIVTKTTEYESAQGWIHGYLIAVSGDGSELRSKQLQWSIVNENLPFPHSHYTNDDINHWEEIKTIESEQYISINNYDNFPAFKAVKNYPVHIPIQSTSSWFIPSIHWFKRLSFELTRYRYPGIIMSWADYWTASQADSSNSVYVHFHGSTSKRGTFIFDSFACGEKNHSKYILPIAAF